MVWTTSCFSHDVQQDSGFRYPNYCYQPLLHLVAEHTTIMLRIARVAMLRLTNLGRPGAKRWCTALVLVAVCALTIYVATRYDRCVHVSDRNHTVVASPETFTPGLQRLLNNAATWIPPLVCAAIFDDRGYYSQPSQPDPKISSALLERSLFYRPPPSSHLV